MKLSFGAVLGQKELAFSHYAEVKLIIIIIIIMIIIRIIKHINRERARILSKITSFAFSNEAFAIKGALDDFTPQCVSSVNDNSLEC
jgi:hypothetical protein